MKLLSRARILLVATLALFTVGGMQNVTAATVALFPVADTYIRNSAPVSNFGTTTPILVGIALAGSPRQHCLFRFSLDGIPSGAVINSATLQLIAIAGPRESYDFDLNRLLVSWTENGATWNVRQTGSSWSSAGAQSGSDYAASPSATAVLSPVPVTGQAITNIFSSPAMAADVQSWLDNPASNFGWILHVAGTQAGSGRQLASREDATLKPVLTVEYTVSGTPAPAPPTILGTSIEAGTIRFSFNAESNRTYAVEFRDSLTTGDWAVLTNIPAQPADTTVHVTNSITSDQRYFRARTP